VLQGSRGEEGHQRGKEERKVPLPIHVFLSLPILPIPVFAPAMEANGREMVKPSNAVSCVRA